MDEYGYSIDGEVFYGDEECREDAAAVAVEECVLFPGSTFDTGRLVRKTIADVIPDARDLIEKMQIAVSAEIGELGESWLANITVENIDDLQRAVRAAIVGWADQANLNTEYIAICDWRTHRVLEDGSTQMIEESENG
jgi:hypothetical protein